MVNWTHVLQDLGNVKTIILTLTVWVHVTVVAIFWALAGPRLQIPALRLIFPAHGIFQARILKWVAISFSRGSSPPRDRTEVSRIVGRCFTI